MNKLRVVRITDKAFVIEGVCGAIHLQSCDSIVAYIEGNILIVKECRNAMTRRHIKRFAELYGITEINWNNRRSVRYE